MDLLSYTVNLFTAESGPVDGLTKDQVGTSTFSRRNSLKDTFPAACLFNVSTLIKISCIYYLIILNYQYRRFTDKSCQKITVKFLSHFNKTLQVSEI